MSNAKVWAVRKAANWVLLAAVLGPAVAQASYVDGSLNFIDFGSDASFTASTLTFSSDTVFGGTHNGAFSSFATLAPFSINSPVSLAGVVIADPSNPANVTSVNYSDFMSFGSFQFNLTAIQKTNVSDPLLATLYGYGTLIDTNPADGFAPTAAEFTISGSGSSGLTNYSGTFYAEGSATVPIPAPLWLLCSGMAGLGAMGFRRKFAVA